MTPSRHRLIREGVIFFSLYVSGRNVIPLPDVIHRWNVMVFGTGRYLAHRMDYPIRTEAIPFDDDNHEGDGAFRTELPDVRL